ncbi:MAG: GNAT family N-acetyltransferase [Candidatus Pacebacteria bacterium]|nr:GNAT family N-acetyltransferase [Candidatus Paceibacterota bacterium]
MKIFASEFGHSYETYSFAYNIYAEKEAGDDLSLLYEKGFLPYSGSRNVKNIFYMARGTRADIHGWKPTSENRRVLRFFDGHFEKRDCKVSDVRENEQFFNLCLSYFNLAHGGAMPRERLELILDSGLVTRIVEYKKDNEPQAYLLLVETETVSHYWYSFFKEEYIKTSLGMWLALDHIRTLATSSKRYFYFGTCYAEKALYKTNVEPLEFWDGREWLHDIPLLKSLCRSDTERHIDNHLDLFKKNFEQF